MIGFTHGSCAAVHGSPLGVRCEAGRHDFCGLRSASRDQSGGTYSLVKTTTSTSYTNTGAKSGVTYYYKVIAVHSKSAANSAYSLVDSIKSK